MATDVLLALIIVGAVGCIIGFLLCIASKALEIKVDEKEAAVLDVLPGNNCGACGFPGCSGLAASIAKGEAEVNACPVGGAATAKLIAEIMGTEAGETERQVAYVKCLGTCDRAKDKYIYNGVKDCVAVGFVPGGGAKECRYGCSGFGTCVRACEFDAIRIENGIAVIDPYKCKACSKCVAACPKHLIEMIPESSEYVVSCMNNDKGKACMDVCSISCIGCGLCAKNCPADAITMEGNYAHIDQSKCTRCGVCAEKCPRKCITTPEQYIEAEISA